MVTLNAGFKNGWDRFRGTKDVVEKDYEFAELLNLIEISCAIHWEKSLAGVSRELSREYVQDVLLLFEGDLDAMTRLEKAIHDPKTFKYIKYLRSDMRKRAR